MSPSEIIQLVGLILTSFTTLGVAYIAFLGREIRHATNSIVEARVEEKGRSAHAEGMEAGRILARTEAHEDTKEQ